MGVSGPFEENRRRGGPILAFRVGVCVPFASIATLALNGSEDFDAFALKWAGRANASKTPENQPKPNSHVTQKAQTAQKLASAGMFFHAMAPV